MKFITYWKLYHVLGQWFSFSRKHFCRFLLRHFGYWDVSGICLTVMLKLTIAVLITLAYIYRHSDWNDLIFLVISKAFQSMTEKNSLHLLKLPKKSKTLVNCFMPYFKMTMTLKRQMKSLHDVTNKLRGISTQCLPALQNNL